LSDVSVGGASVSFCTGVVFGGVYSRIVDAGTLSRVTIVAKGSVVIVIVHLRIVEHWGRGKRSRSPCSACNLALCRYRLGPVVRHLAFFRNRGEKEREKC
jgi:hypothetical protein